MKDGRLAAEDVAGQAAALSGGYANSYGTTAAGQAYMGAIDKIYDKVPELEAQAYGRYQDKRNADLQNWEILQNRAATERGNAESERAYKDDRDAYLMQLALQNYDILQNKADKERAYAESERDYKDSRDAYLWELALQKAQLGDFSGLKTLGVDTSTAQKQNELDFALAAASYGDYSFLKALGIDTSAVDSPKTVYYSSGSGGGGDDDPKPKTGDPQIYPEDEFDKEIQRLQAVIDDPKTGEGNKRMAEKQLEKFKRYLYG